MFCKAPVNASAFTRTNSCDDILRTCDAAAVAIYTPSISYQLEKQRNDRPSQERDEKQRGTAFTAAAVTVQDQET
jgi:hypothetical protein